MAGQDTLAKYGQSFQTKAISALVSDAKLLDKLHEVIEEKFFESDVNKWIIGEIIEYYDKYKKPPTVDVFKVRVTELDDKGFQKRIVEQLKEAYVKMEDDDLDYIKDEFEEFCINQNLKSAILNSVDLLKAGAYDRIKDTIDKAMKVGVDNNMGHDYILDYSERTEDVNRDTVPSNWEVIDDLMDGGLGPGELGVVVAPSGVGKCVGGDTTIDIEYEEIGFEISENFIAWFKPWDKIHLNDDLYLYAYQVENLLSTDVGKTT